MILCHFGWWLTDCLQSGNGRSDCRAPSLMEAVYKVCNISDGDTASTPGWNLEVLPASAFTWELDQPRISLFLFFFKKHQNLLMIAWCWLHFLSGWVFNLKAKLLVFIYVMQQVRIWISCCFFATVWNGLNCYFATGCKKIANANIFMLLLF